VSPFITELAFPPGRLTEVAKMAIFATSLLAAVLAFAIFRTAGRRGAEAGTPAR
jgi:Na+/H+ antiporter NhaA